jgi:hypothetical protein
VSQPEQAWRTLEGTYLIPHYSPEETLINGIFEVVGGALHQYEWYEQERPAPGSLTDRVVREGLVAEYRVSPLFGSTPLNRDAS